MLRRLKKLIPHNSPFRVAWHKMKAIVAATMYGFPGRKVIVVGITGTDGKTTTVTLISKILEKAGYKVGVASTVFFRVGNREWQNTSHMTSLTPFALQRLLRQMVKVGCTHAVLEVSSHALAQYRFWGVPFDVAAITNISPEHMDYHVSMKQYRADKYKLFTSLASGFQKGGVPKTIIINADDADTFSDLAHLPADRVLGYSMSMRLMGTMTEYIRGVDIEYFSDHTDLTLSFGKDLRKVRLYLQGAHNVENLLCASSVGLALGASLSDIERSCVEVSKVPGRMEMIDEGQPFKVFLDFAMTQKGYEQILKTLRGLTEGKLWVVFGCCGDRDKYKRSVIGEVCARHADKVVVTDDEPYSEDPGSIRAMILEGVADSRLVVDQDYWEIPDRKEALRHAILQAGPGDILVVPGMGDFEGRTFADGRIPWSDREVLRELLRELKSL